MKRTAFILSTTASLVLVFLIGVYAGQTVLLGSPITFTGTTNTTAISVGPIAPPRGSWLINYATLNSTNQLTGTAQMSLDNTNWINIGTYNPSQAASNTDTFIPAYTNQPIFYRMQLVATQNTSVIVTFSN